MYSDRNIMRFSVYFFCNFLLSRFSELTEMTGRLSRWGMDTSYTGSADLEAKVLMLRMGRHKEAAETI